MIIGHEDGFAVGGSRYGSRKNDGSRGVGPVCEDCERGHHGGCGLECDCDCGSHAKQEKRDKGRQNAVSCGDCGHPAIDHTSGGCFAHISPRPDGHGGTITVCECKRKPFEMRNAAGCGQCGTTPAKRYMVDGETKLLCAECAAKMGGKLLNSDPIARRDNGRTAGQERYGSRLNDDVGTCRYCGHKRWAHTDGNGNAAGCSICDCDGFGKAKE